MVANKVSSRLFISIAVAATLAVSVAAAVAGKKFPGPYILSFFDPRILRVPMGFGKDLVFEHMEGFITLMGGRAPLLLWAYSMANRKIAYTLGRGWAYIFDQIPENMFHPCSH
jgi:hypothetical protein